MSSATRASGIDKVDVIADLVEFEAKLPGLLTRAGPTFITLMIEQGPLGPRSYDEMYRPERRAALRKVLAEGT